MQLRSHALQADDVEHRPKNGMRVCVTADAAVYEQECRASQLSWPNLNDGQPRRSRMGREGCIEKIDISDMTACISDGVSWVPIRALVGFENFKALKL